jgi:hypothetical protein
MRHILSDGGDLLRRREPTPTARAAWPLRALTGALLAGLLLTAAARADDTQWRDYESRIQYGYYTEDLRALHNLADALAQEESHQQPRGYYAALASWRLAQLALQSAAREPGISATQSAQGCVKSLDAVLEAQAEFAEGLALRAACAQGAGGLHVPFAGHSPRKDLDRALQLAPRNPRVLLFDAESDYPLTGGPAVNPDRALAKLRQAVAAFEAERGGAEPLPGWGAAEAYFLLGRDLLDHGDAVGARDALEHALLLAPEYLRARRLMTKIASG